MKAKDPTPAQKFRREISAVLIRWTEESDLSEEQMEHLAYYEVERFYSNSVDFETDPGWLDTWNEEDDGPSAA